MARDGIRKSLEIEQILFKAAHAGSASLPRRVFTNSGDKCASTNPQCHDFDCLAKLRNSNKTSSHKYTHLQPYNEESWSRESIIELEILGRKKNRRDFGLDLCKLERIANVIHNLKPSSRLKNEMRFKGFSFSFVWHTFGNPLYCRNFYDVIIKL